MNNTSKKDNQFTRKADKLTEKLYGIKSALDLSNALNDIRDRGGVIPAEIRDISLLYPTSSLIEHINKMVDDALNIHDELSLFVFNAEKTFNKKSAAAITE